jgi:hypothetical protein
VVTYDQVAAIALALPDVHEGARHGSRTWFIGKVGFAWERPFSKADIKRFGDEMPPDGPILAVSTGDLGEKEAVLGAGTKGVFTISHFDGYPAVLLQLKVMGVRVVRELVVDAWLACAPDALAESYVANEKRRRRR